MVRIALAQINQTVGDLDGNSIRILDAIRKARERGAQVLALPELAITGYPPEDLLRKKSFVDANRRALDELAAETHDSLVVIGFVDQEDDSLFNAAALCHGGRVISAYRKQRLPNYGVFDERRYFEPGLRHTLVETNAGVIGVCVCEDVWFADGPAVTQGDAGAQVVININASPFHKNKLAERATMLGERARRAATSIAYVNMVGGQDELVFDGGSLVVGPDGATIARFPQFDEHFGVVGVPLGKTRTSRRPEVERLAVEVPTVEGSAPGVIAQTLDWEAEIYEALRLALRDYVRKNRFDKVVVGLSGGIDSALTATIATDALGAEAVLGISMPSEFSSDHSKEDAKALAGSLRIELREIEITPFFHAYQNELGRAEGTSGIDLAQENLQARIRGNILMFVSNREGHLVVATGNKSELACGYATLYGDMAGGFALLKDVFKTEVYDLAQHRNRLGPVIPERVLTKPPSAELRPDQKDSDSLPPYEVLDVILESYIENDADVEEIVKKGVERATVEQVITLVDKAEYKRRQAPPGPKVTTKAFGRDRRLPITNAWVHPSPGPPGDPGSKSDRSEG